MDSTSCCTSAAVRGEWISTSADLSDTSAPSPPMVTSDGSDSLHAPFLSASLRTTQVRRPSRYMCRTPSLSPAATLTDSIDHASLRSLGPPRFSEEC